jgi:hypothetical protein
MTELEWRGKQPVTTAMDGDLMSSTGRWFGAWRR